VTRCPLLVGLAVHEQDAGCGACAQDAFDGPGAVQTLARCRSERVDPGRCGEVDGAVLLDAVQFVEEPVDGVQPVRHVCACRPVDQVVQGFGHRVGQGRGVQAALGGEPLDQGTAALGRGPAAEDQVGECVEPGGGSITISYSPLLESAHRVGRALVDLDNAELAETVRKETAAELASVESAELGALTGRAQQAALLSCEGASPVQVAAADRLFEVDPFGADALFCDIDPTAGATAAAHWLYAAAEAASEASGHASTEVVQEADNIEALAHETPTLVLELIEAGISPYEATLCTWPTGCCLIRLPSARGWTRQRS
jgi:hypothetical protein